ncbi:PAS domain-containing protein [Flavobacterium wongokense]|uniref:PAS domain-containing protein n=1 Tax=Flavobacterium wongokense TaxID=2910674 RepID=UPI001F39ACCE|nr:PAS domain-containing protein [Flavobacterium sp. WG47]MCF6131839.1 PAS domain-containing protein [Flavobacterium sp. WG47]
MMPKITNSDLQFLAGGGEMGQLMREKDWSKNPLGNPETWPQSLRITLSILLNSKFPMFLFWGQELICFYNDGYRPSLGNNGKHPDILGGRGEDFWKEIWKDIKPLIDNALEKGEASWFEDLLLPIYRNGKMEDVYWTFSYSPVNDESGKPAGVFVTCNETTEKVNLLNHLSESNQRFYNNIRQAPLAMCILKGKDFVVEIANNLMLQIWGKDEADVLNKPLFEGLPEAREQGFEVLLESVYATGEKFEANERLVSLPRTGKLENTYLNFVYEPLREANGEITGIVASAADVTKQVIDRTKLEETEQKVRALVENAPFAIAVYTGEEMRVELANQAIIDIWGKGNDVIGKTFTEILPELAGQSVFEQIKEVYSTGKAFHTQNTPLELIVNGKKGTYYFNYDFTPLYDLSGNIYGVMNTGVDLTELNLAKQKIEEGDTRFRNTVKQAPVGIIILRGKDYVVEMVNDAYMQIVDFNESEFVGLPLFDSIPEAKESTLSLMDHVMDTGEPFHGYEVTVPLKRNNRLEFCNFDFVYHPLKEDDGSISGMIVTVTDVTEKVASRKKIEESDARFRNTVKQAPVGITILRGKDYVVEMANDAYLQLVDRKEETFLHKPLFDSLPEVKETVQHLLDGVRETGVAYHGYEVPIPLVRNEQLGTFYFDFLYHPLKEDDGSISGIIVTVTEVTEKVQSRKKIERNEERLNIVIEASELGTWELNLKTHEAIYSQRYLEIISGSKEYKKLTHEQLIKYLHPDDLENRNKALATALATGILNYEARLIWDDKSIHWMEGRGKVFYDEENQPIKMVGTIRDITKERDAQLLLVKNEQKFRLLADSMPQHIWTADIEGNLNYFNQSVLDYSGMSLKQIYEKGWLDIVHPDDRDENIRLWMESIVTGKDFLYQHRFRRFDGIYRWQLSRAIPQKGENGEIQMWVGTSTDIQDQKEFTQELEKQVNERTKELNNLNETLKQSEERYHLMVEEVQDYAILYLNNEGIVENWNKGAEKIKGYKADEIVGKSFSNFYTPEDQKSNLPQYVLNHAAKYGRYVHEGWRVRKDGTRFWANVVITAVHNESGEIIGYSKMTHDLTFKKEADDKIKLNSEILEQKNRELEKMNKELQSFAYISSHDLQEPLRKIQTFADQIAERESENLSENAKDKFKRMQNAAKRMQTLINDLLAYSRTNTQEVKLKKTNLNDIVEEVKEDLKEELQLKNGTIEIGKLGEAEIIPFQFHQLMFNLASNSLKFSRENVPPHITIKGEIVKGKDTDNDKLDPKTKYCHITFSDNGIGFEQQYSDKIFEVFQRLHGKEVYQGTGIGLAIVKKIVDNHNGVITAKGALGQGATFNIYIPINGGK